jgi:hypothetical protein
MNTDNPQSPNEIESEKPKSGRRRRTKAEIEAARAAEADKPIDPVIWLILGGLLLFVAACIFFDPMSFMTAGQSQTDGMWIRDILVIVVGIAGKNPTALIIAVLALLSLGWGLYGWLQKRSAGNLP